MYMTLLRVCRVFKAAIDVIPKCIDYDILTQQARSHSTDREEFVSLTEKVKACFCWESNPTSKMRHLLLASCKLSVSPVAIPVGVDWSFMVEYLAVWQFRLYLSMQIMPEMSRQYALNTAVHFNGGGNLERDNQEDVEQAIFCLIAAINPKKSADEDVDIDFNSQKQFDKPVTSVRRRPILTQPDLAEIAVLDLNESLMHHCSLPKLVRMKVSQCVYGFAFFAIANNCPSLKEFATLTILNAKNFNRAFEHATCNNTDSRQLRFPKLQTLTVDYKFNYNSDIEDFVLSAHKLTILCPRLAPRETTCKGAAASHRYGGAGAVQDEETPAGKPLGDTAAGSPELKDSAVSVSQPSPTYKMTDGSIRNANDKLDGGVEPATADST
ncbi:hypothetical protein HDU76_001682, partial [Blyttiomyces sp. JEL0837]